MLFAGIRVGKEVASSLFEEIAPAFQHETLPKSFLKTFANTVNRFKSKKLAIILFKKNDTTS